MSWNIWNKTRNNQESRIVDLLLKNGASPNIKDSDGKVPLNYAIHVAIIKLINKSKEKQTSYYLIILR